VLSKNVEKVLNFPCNSISFVCRKVQKVEQGFFSFTAFVCAAIGKYPENRVSVREIPIPAPRIRIKLNIPEMLP
jgi:hypothetical protein